MSPRTVQSRKIQERSFSLTDSLRAVASVAGSPPSRDDLHAAMGLPFMICVPLDESDSPRDWPLLARDVFLVEAGHLFGMGIRDMHPPEASVGLDQLAVFRQHFVASYRPLVGRALENGQHVLSWQGWPGDDGHLWGVIQNVDDDASGLGISGRTGPNLRDGLDAGKVVAFAEPPVQIHVVETIAATAPEPDTERLWQMVLHHTRLSLCNECTSRFNVLTGVPAVDAWRARFSKLDATSEQYAAHVDDHRICALESAAGLSALIRYARGAAEQLPKSEQTMLRTLTAASHKASTALAAMANATLASCGDDPHRLHTTILEQLHGARSALAELLEIFSD